ncbi:hypothetical protein CC80DRAFT_541405 [Byssothecium circinans]|uniref:SnoaL-like domain-containing protein n=1 Tax=Byssothecium circinans TaxID=147558 RepID=A0A6A5UE48_9PLEO|nr:hypothetical protein CC80DRAFT_541405 [Byssothecium circinans]
MEVFSEAMTKLSTFEEYSFEAQNIIAEGNSVLLDIACHGKGPGPVEYHQNYAFILTTSEGKIVDLKVWSDPFQVKAWMELTQKYQTELASKETPAHV